MREIGALLLFLTPLAMHDGQVPYVLRDTSVAKNVVRHIDSEPQCLANVIFHEAGGEPVEGQRAVYEVVMHRARAFHSSLCSVVKAPMQFSWYGKKPMMPMTKPMQDLLARVKMHPRVLDSVKFKWFYSGDKTPRWAEDMDCREIGGHKFCKERDKEEQGG